MPKTTASWFINHCQDQSPYRIPSLSLQPGRRAKVEELDMRRRAGPIDRREGKGCMPDRRSLVAQGPRRGAVLMVWK